MYIVAMYKKKEIFAFGTAGRGALCVFIFFRPLVVSRCFFFPILLIFTDEPGYR